MLESILVIQKLTVHLIRKLSVIDLSFDEARQPPRIRIRLVEVEVDAANARRFENIYANAMRANKPACAGNLPEMPIFLAKNVLRIGEAE